ncbi:MAG TPA: heme-binding domain-containing protein [Polyangiaceae bacterium]
MLGFSALFVAIQFVPYGRSHSNPPVVKEPDWTRPTTRALAVRACFDCHSNETAWPWYSHVAPVSWLVERHVVEGRRALNFSEWNHGNDEAEEASEAVLEGEMPLSSYLLAHPTARLAASDRDELARGLDLTIGGERR